MNDCLVKKLKGTLNVPNMPVFNVLKVKLTKTDNEGSGIIGFQRMNTSSYAKNLTFKILSGNAYFTTDGTNNIGTETDANAPASVTYVKVVSGESVVGIMNFDTVANALGSGLTAPYSWLVPLTGYATHGLTIDFDFSGISDKSWITEINMWECSDMVKGNIKSLNTLTGLTSLYLNKANTVLEGNINDIGSLDSLQHLTICNSVKNGGSSNSNIYWNCESLAALSSLTEIQMDGSYCEGGDLYQLFNSRSSLKIIAIRCNDAHGQRPAFTCSYVSGTSTVPTIAISTISFYRTATMDKANAIAFLTMLKDGATASKITCSDSITIKTAASSDEDVVALKNQLSGLGITVTLT